MVTNSPPATVTIAAAPGPTLVISQPTLTPNSLPYTGGNITVSGTTNYADGTALTILVNGVSEGVASVTGGAYSGSVSIAANATQQAVTDTVIVQGP